MHRLSLNKAGDKNTDQQKSEYASSRIEPLLPKSKFINILLERVQMNDGKQDFCKLNCLRRMLTLYYNLNYLNSCQSSPDQIHFNGK